MNETHRVVQYMGIGTFPFYKTLGHIIKYGTPTEEATINDISSYSHIHNYLKPLILLDLAAQELSN